MIGTSKTFLVGGLIIILSLLDYLILRYLRNTDNYLLKGIIGFTFIIILCTIDYLLFEQFIIYKNGYFVWFLNYGPFISLSFAIIGTIWDDLNINTALIEIYPPNFIAGCIWLIAMFFKATSIHMGGVGESVKRMGEYSKSIGESIKVQITLRGLGDLYGELFKMILSLFDSIMSLLVIFFILIIVIIWSLLIAPMLYFVHIIAGAPARIALFSKTKRLVATREDDGSLSVQEMHSSAPLPLNSTEVSFTKKPVAVTSAISAALIWIAQLVWSG